MLKSICNQYRHFRESTKSTHATLHEFNRYVMPACIDSYQLIFYTWIDSIGGFCYIVNFVRDNEKGPWSIGWFSVVVVNK